MSTKQETILARSDARTALETLPRLAGVQRAGMLDWPGRVAATVFLSGCNLRCAYCHNPDLVSTSRRSESVESFFQYVADRRAWLDGVVITGGEPTLEPRLRPLIERLKREGMPVKLDTNGTSPDVLAELLDAGLLDFVAMDIKALPERYERVTGRADLWPSVKRSIDLIIASGVDHEFRTTCYPIAVGPNDLPKIASLLVGGQRYALQQFRPQRTLDPAAVSVRAHESSTLCRAAERCGTYLPTIVRGC